MSCPHFSRVSGECGLEQGRVEDSDDDVHQLAAEDPVSREWCLGTGKRYRECPIFRRFIAELSR